jgi:signal peptidase I
MKKPLSSSPVEPLSGSSFVPVKMGMNGELLVDMKTHVADSNVLVTVSSEKGSHTVLLRGDQVIETEAKLFVDTPPERVITGRDKLLRKVGAWTTLLGYAFAAVLVTFSVASVTGYVKARVVLTGSMKPSINPGDIVLTAPPSRVEPAIGKVISYQARQFNGAPVGVFSHRIVGGNAKDGWVLKGDNNPDPDVQHPKGADVLGVVVYVIPFVGKLLSKRFLFTAIPLVIGFWFLMDTLREVPND